MGLPHHGQPHLWTPRDRVVRKLRSLPKRRSFLGRAAEFTDSQRHVIRYCATLRGRCILASAVSRPDTWKDLRYEMSYSPIGSHTLSGVDAETREATCAVCGPTKAISNGAGWRCGLQKRAQKLQSLYGTSESEVPGEFGVCAICRRNDVVLCVDHDHTTGKVRGWLCHSCNLMIGGSQENPVILHRAMEYLLERG